MANVFDVIILGGGPAGYVAAILSAQLGMSTAVIEKEKLGGVCVNIGCIPTKALLHSAYIARLLRDAKEFGVEAGAVKTDYGVAMQRSRKVSDQNSKGVEFLMKKNKVTVVKGAGVLQPGRKVKVGNDVYEAKKAVIIATGSRVRACRRSGWRSTRRPSFPRTRPSSSRRRRPRWRSSALEPSAWSSPTFSARSVPP